MAIRIWLISFKFHYTMCCDGLCNAYFHYENYVNIHRRELPMKMSAVLNVAIDYLFF